jgi:glucosamine--fructose-6-phosphate aminotransferase (isomerizing)
MQDRFVSLMLQEIREQPAALERMLDEDLSAVADLRKHLEKQPPRLIVLAARGTSDNAAQFGRYLLELFTGIPVSLAAPSVYTLYGAKLKLDGALVIGVSQSGESTDVNIVLEAAKEQGAVTAGVTNEASSRLARIADHAVLVRAGKERSVAATKTYTGQLLAMYLIAHALGAPIDLDQLRRIPEWAAAAMATEEAAAAAAIRYRFMERCVVIGRGLNYANAFEMALKLMETCYVIAERFSGADLLHGPIAMVEQGFPAFLFSPPGVTAGPMAETAAKLESRGAETFAIQSGQAPARGIHLPFDLEELYTPIPYIIPAQFFAAHLAREKGFNPDQPRALSKVTQTL